MPRSPEPTRMALISAAEELFAEVGVAAATTSAITDAAGQKNKNAVGFHFGSKDALLEAVLDKHQRHIAGIRDELLGQTPERVTAGHIARVLVEPLAQRLLDADGGVAYLRIQAELAGRSDPERTRERGGATARLFQLAEDWAGAPAADLVPQMRLIVTLVFHGLAEFATRNPLPSPQAVADFSSLLTDDVAALLEVGAARARRTS